MQAQATPYLTTKTDVRFRPTYTSYRTGQTSEGSALKRQARLLGWLSMGLGAAELLTPSVVARLIGAPNTWVGRVFLRLCGLREFALGAGILSHDDDAGWVWARVGGDVADLALLGAAMVSHGAKPARLIGAAAMVAGVLALDAHTAQNMSAVRGDTALWRSQPVHHAITVNRPIGEVYAFWRNFANLPQFMAHVESVRVIDSQRSHWQVKGPAGQHIEWDAVISEDTPNSCIAWRSLPGAQIVNSGSVQFSAAPGDQGTEIRVRLTYGAPGGRLGVAVARLLGEEPSMQVSSELRRFKQIMEAGEVLCSDASIHYGMRPAQPVGT